MFILCIWALRFALPALYLSFLMSKALFRLQDMPRAIHDRRGGTPVRYPFKYEAQTALFKDPVRTALLCYVLTL